jgi:hypothetical protein
MHGRKRGQGGLSCRPVSQIQLYCRYRGTLLLHTEKIKMDLNLKNVNRIRIIRPIFSEQQRDLILNNDLAPFKQYFQLSLKSFLSKKKDTTQRLPLITHSKQCCRSALGSGNSK